MMGTYMVACGYFSTVLQCSAWREHVADSNRLSLWLMPRETTTILVCEFFSFLSKTCVMCWFCTGISIHLGSVCVWGGIHLKFDSQLITTGWMDQIVQSLTVCPVGSCLVLLNIVLFGRGLGSVVPLGRRRSGVTVRGLNETELRTWWSLSCTVRCEGVLVDWTDSGGDSVLF